MPTLEQIFKKCNVMLYDNESLDLDHYYQERYQDENDEIKEMGEPFETDKSRKKRSLDLTPDDLAYSGFSFFMDGSRRTYKIGDMVIGGKKIYPVVVAQVRAGCTQRDERKKLHSYGEIQRKNLLLISDKLNDVDFIEIKQRILKTTMAKISHLMKASNNVSVPIKYNGDFLIGPEGAHMNISGISGLATKTSYVMFLLKAIQYKYKEDVATVQTTY